METINVIINDNEKASLKQTDDDDIPYYKDTDNPLQKKKKQMFLQLFMKLIA